jgi:hypothetical protein
MGFHTRHISLALMYGSSDLGEMRVLRPDDLTSGRSAIVEAKAPSKLVRPRLGEFRIFAVTTPEHCRTPLSPLGARDLNGSEAMTRQKSLGTRAVDLLGTSSRSQATGPKPAPLFYVISPRALSATPI